jgi:hypothetical protein
MQIQNESPKFACPKIFFLLLKFFTTKLGPNKLLGINMWCASNDQKRSKFWTPNNFFHATPFSSNFIRFLHIYFLFPKSGNGRILRLQPLVSFPNLFNPLFDVLPGKNINFYIAKLLLLFCVNLNIKKINYFSCFRTSFTASVSFGCCPLKS